MIRNVQMEGLQLNMPKLCILAAGRGSRLGAFTNAVNKALLPVKDKAVLSHIIEKVPLDSEIVLALGYQGAKVQQYCEIAHPDRTFHFVFISNYDGPGSGPGRSMWECRKFLQQPFYFCTADCIVPEELPALTQNWLGVADTNEPEHFCTVKVNDSNNDGRIDQIFNKQKDGSSLAFIGLAGIKSYHVFWQQLEEHMHNNGSKETELVAAFSDPSIYEDGIVAKKLTWLDTGTIESYTKTRQYFEGNQCFDFSKVGEFTYIVGTRVVKYFDDPERVTNRVHRGFTMKHAIPLILSRSKNFFAYRYEAGKTLYTDLENIHDHGQALYDWCQKVLWTDQRTIPAPNFKDSCYRFYHDKTIARYNEYKAKKGLVKKDSSNQVIINGVSCSEIEYYLDKINWENLAVGGIPVVFHGDLQFDNIIITPDGNYVLLDWRDSFADQKIVGDLYYDLAKLNGGLILPYSIIKSGAFSFCKDGNSLEFAYDVPVQLKSFKTTFEHWLEVHGYDVKKVELLTSLIYLNMSPLHAAPFDDLLFSLAKLRLQAQI